MHEGVGLQRQKHSSRLQLLGTTQQEDTQPTVVVCGDPPSRHHVQGNVTVPDDDGCCSLTRCVEWTGEGQSHLTRLEDSCCLEPISAHGNLLSHGNIQAQPGTQALRSCRR